MSTAKSQVQKILNREVEVEPTKLGKYICKFVDYNNPHPSALVSDTEDGAYEALLTYLNAREVVRQPAVGGVPPGQHGEDQGGNSTEP